ncbi:MAG: Flp pilus assembly complex ATPase component TadA [Lachnospiraceae bacterium]|nr:Flp pilus assembly complex ATPase component TadA [Lachnospiraceae bacterium]
MNLFWKQKKLQNELKRNYSLREMEQKVIDMLQEYTGENLLDCSIKEEFRKTLEEHRRTVSESIRSCCSGNPGAKDTVVRLIQSFLRKELKEEHIKVGRLVSFENPKQISAWHQMETLIYLFDKEKSNCGFGRMCDYFGWSDASVITEQQIYQAYVEKMSMLTEQDEIEVLSQILYASTVGLGIVDTLNQQSGFIEEIQIGMSGKPELQYDYRLAMKEGKKEEGFSRNGVHIMARGCTIWLQFLSFETEEELQRVLRNLIKESQGGELTRNHPMLVVDAVDGRRISVSRPPMTDTWVGLIRKFDTVKEVSLEKLYKGYPEEKLLPGLLRQLVRSGRNIAITGEMASGKTTLFRACLAEAKQDMNIRVIEVDSFELNVRVFLPKANCMTMRVTEQTPAEEVLAFARKTTGQIFAIGEINSAAVAAMAMDLSKIASQMFFSAHYITTEHMIADFVNAKLCIGGYSEESLAELDVVRCLGFDVHLRNKEGRRYVQYINEIVPVARNSSKKGKTYEIRQIYHYDSNKE